MELFVCWGTFPRVGPRHIHACHRAHAALKTAGYEPRVVRTYGWRVLPDVPFNLSKGRRRVKRLTGKTTVPVLVTDTGEVLSDSRRIAAWASEARSRARWP